VDHDGLVQNFFKLVQGIRLCMESRLVTPTLILVYCGIDIAGWLWTRQDSTPVDRRFIEWTSKYLLPGSPLKCRAVDIYGARCGLVHTLSATSNLSVQGKARRIIYAWGSSRVETLHEVTQFFDREQSYVAVQLEDLVVAFSTGLDRFLTDLQKNPKRGARAYQRAEQFFTDLSESTSQEYLRLAREATGKSQRRPSH